MKRLLVVVLMLFAVSSSHAVDTNIRVLSVYFDGEANPLDALLSMEAVFDAYAGVDGSPATPMTYVNGNLPVPIPPIEKISNSSLFTELLAQYEPITTLRNQFAADLVLVYIGTPLPNTLGTICGTANTGNPIGHWVDTLAGTMSNPSVAVEASFSPELNPTSPFFLLDRRGSETVYLAYVALDGACETVADVSATHEFGHLFGAGHAVNITPGNDNWLTPNSHAFGSAFITPGGIFCSFSAMSDGRDRGIICPGSVLPPGVSNSYSVGASIQPNANNQETIQITRRSVANYRVGTAGDGNPPITECNDGVDNDNDGHTDLEDADCEGIFGGESGSTGPAGNPSAGGCAIARPIAVTSFQSGPDCNPLPWTRYIIQWLPGNSCPVSYYDFFDSTPDGSPFRYTGSTTGTSEDVFVTGGSQSRIRVRACNSSGECTGLSQSSALVFPRC